MQIQQANYYKIIGRDTNSLQANTRRAPQQPHHTRYNRSERGGEGRIATPRFFFFIFPPFKSQQALAASPFAVQIRPSPLCPDATTQSTRIVTSIDYVKVKPPPSLYNEQR